jgi:hypothetical protein
MVLSFIVVRKDGLYDPPCNVPFWGMKFFKQSFRSMFTGGVFLIPKLPTFFKLQPGAR